MNIFYLQKELFFLNPMQYSMYKAIPAHFPKNLLSVVTVSVIKKLLIIRDKISSVWATQEATIIGATYRCGKD